MRRGLIACPLQADIDNVLYSVKDSASASTLLNTSRGQLTGRTRYCLGLSSNT